MLLIRIHDNDYVELRPPVLKGVGLQCPAPVKEPASVKREVYKACQLICHHKNRGGIAKGLHSKQNPLIGAPKLTELIIHGYS